MRLSECLKHADDMERGKGPQHADAKRLRSGGRRAMLEQLSASEAERCARGTGSPVIVAEYRALADDRSGMLWWLANAEATHDHNLPTLRGYPEFAAYRSDPEFQKIVQRLP